MKNPNKAKHIVRTYRIQLALDITIDGDEATVENVYPVRIDNIRATFVSVRKKCKRKE